MTIATTNLGLAKIQGADYVKPDTFNDNYDLIDKLGVDYVTASGVTGSWGYRKWNSGMLECWGRFSGKMSSGRCNFSQNFPFAYASKPVLAANGGISKTISATVNYAESSTVGFDVYLGRSDNVDVDGYECWLMVYVTGSIKA